MELRDHLAEATRRLEAAGVADPHQDAVALAAHVVGVAAPDQVPPPETRLAHAQVAQFRALVDQRAQRVPLGHLVGWVRVRGITLEVGPGVFVPQPETEPVIGWAVDAVNASGEPAPVIADLCSGAGTIAFTLANELPHARVHAVEHDPGAVAWTRRNAKRRAEAGDTPVTVHLHDVDGCLPDLDGQLDLVAANPPYVATDEGHIPDPEVVGHDPALALWAGDDGLDLVRLVERAARRLLRPGGQVVVEHSDRQGRSAPGVFLQAGGWTEIADHTDQEGRDRFVTARWEGDGPS